MNLQDRATGALLGLAVGDALGTTLEFRPPGTFTPIADIVGGGPFNLKSGEWTDDTSMALCLAESLIERQAFEPIDQLERYTRWWVETCGFLAGYEGNGRSARRGHGRGIQSVWHSCRIEGHFQLSLPRSAR